MTRAVVLLRGVNVGGHHRVPMTTWRELLGTLGMKDVRTLLNSGNAVGRVGTRSLARLAPSVRTALRDTLQVDVPVVVVSADTFASIIAENRLAAADVAPSRLLVAFAQEPHALPALASITPLLGPDEQWQLGTHAAYLHCPHGIRDSKAATALLGRAGQSVTTRNWATVCKLHALLTEDAS